VTSLQDYFRRIGFTGTARADRETLGRVLAAHVCRVPFENIDVQFGQRLTTDTNAALDKIIGQGRGGWCFEQNAVFGWALREIGFEVTRVAAAVMRHEHGDASLADHLCLLVRCEDSPLTWLADVGFGGSMIMPIELAENSFEQAPFQLGLQRLGNDEWRFWEDAGGGQFSFDFSTVPANEAALSDRCQILQTDPNSGFVLNLVVQRRATDSQTSLRGRVLQTNGPQGTETRTLVSPEELVTVLSDEFGLDMPDAARLWPRILARHSEVMRDRS